MPLHLPFNFPYFYNNRNYRRMPTPYYNNTHYQNNYKSQNSIQGNSNHNMQNYFNDNLNHNIQNNFQDNSNPNIQNNIQATKLNDSKKNPENSEDENRSETSECFFEIFGIKLHFDDVLIICILFFLYKEEVHDQELFLCLVLLLIS